ncbi:hypothetical protein RJ639_016578 [Escallonia herrerae]|uniref:DUF7036 domain-containing protein n=1 Tax=Escallonia herrerae TaxID=1293975 RepID=A0AA88VIF6_9ASTE|nr:hypothetical protein RJ639_016578 [Escallonia herrerae]
MGKGQQLPLHQPQQIRTGGSNSGLFCPGCSACLSRIGRQFSFKCVVVLIFSLAVFLSAVFLVFPFHFTQFGFDAKEEIKLRATVQVYFRLEKPVALLVPHIPRLEYDIYGEIGIPNTKVAVLSMHQASAYNWTYVVFGVLPDDRNVTINAVSLSVLRSSLIELFLQQINLTLTTSTFGEPSSFEILMFPGGITIIPEQSASIWQIPQILFNFTLPNSIDEITENFAEFKKQLKLGLQLWPDENLYIQVTNENGSTRDPPVTVQASVMSEIGNLLPQRLKQLAQTITGSPAATNLGLDNSVFGRVKEISLSSYLNRTLQVDPPTPSPAPSPEQDDYSEPSISPFPAASPADGSYPLAPSPDNRPHQSLPPISSPPVPSTVYTWAPHPSPHCSSKTSPSPSSSSSDFRPITSPAFPPSLSPTSRLSPGPPPLPVVSYGSHPGQDKSNGRGSASPAPEPPSVLPYSSSSMTGRPHNPVWWFCVVTLATFHLLFW